MKRSQSVPWIIILLLLALLIYREFNRSIPVDREKVKEHVISLKDAANYTKAFDGAKDELQAQLKDSSFLSTKFKLPVCELFNKDAIASLLNQKGASGVRIYLGLNNAREVVFVLVPVTEKGKDLRGKLTAQNSLWIPGVSTAYAQDEGDEEAIERGHRCPHTCDLESPLNPDR